MYYQAFKAYEQTQQQAALILFLLGMGLAAGWLLIGKLLPSRFLPAARWGYSLLVLFLFSLSVFSLGGL